MSSDRGAPAGWYGQDRTERMLREEVGSKWQETYAPMRHIDPVVVLAALALAGIGIVMIYSATSQRNQLAGLPANTEAIRQLMSLGIAVVAMLAAAALSYRHIRTYSWLLYLVAIVGLVLVLTPLGDVRNGAQRWIELGGFDFQPSEPAKLAVIAGLAALLHEQKGEPGLGAILSTLVLVAVPMGLIVMEPDLGTAIVFVWVTFVLLLVGGVRVRYLLGLGGAGVAAVTAIFRYGLLEDYQLQRLTSFLNPGSQELARTSLYNANQSLIAVGSGQFMGKGLFQGTQTNLAYVPENHTDFIFTVIGEEFGFVGAVVVLGLFAVLLWRGLRIAVLSKDLFGTLLAAGIVAVITLQMFVNIGMTIGIMPVTGIPLPFLSFGGTSLIINFVMVGLLLNIHMRRFQTA